MWRIVGLVPGEPRGAGQPARMAAHDLDDADGVRMAHRLRVQGSLAGDGRDKSGGAAVARAVVGAGQIVVDGLGYADYSEIHVPCACGFGDLPGRISRVVTADIDPRIDAVLLAQLDQPLGIVSLQLVATTAQ